MSPTAGTFAAVLSLGAASSSAGTLSSPILTSANAASFECWVTNVGSQVFAIASEGVRDEHGNFLEMATLTCGTALLPAESCTFSAKVGLGSERLRGFIRMAGINGVRAQCQLLTVDGDVIVSADMR